MDKYELQNDQGYTLSTHDNYDEALEAAELFAGIDGVVGHDGDLSCGGDKTLIWANEDASENDPGVNAIGSIRPWIVQ